jgi:hypothetical protein
MQALVIERNEGLTGSAASKKPSLGRSNEAFSEAFRARLRPRLARCDQRDRRRKVVQGWSTFCLTQSNHHTNRGGYYAVVFDSEWALNGDEPKTSTIDLAKKLVAVARSAGCLTADQLKELDDKRATLEQYRKEGMTPKNLKLIRQVLNSEIWARVVNCPDEGRGR